MLIESVLEVARWIPSTSTSIDVTPLASVALADIETLPDTVMPFAGVLMVIVGAVESPGLVLDTLTVTDPD